MSNINAAQIAQIVDLAVAEFGTTESFTAYQIAKIVNAGLLILQIEKDGKVDQVVPQYIYNTTKTLRKANENSFTGEQVKEIATKILNNRINGAKKVSNLADRILAQMTASTEDVEA